VRARALPVGYCYFGDDVCYATKTTAGDRRADAENKNIRTVVVLRSTVYAGEIKWKSSGEDREKKKKKSYSIRRLGVYCDCNIIVRRNASYGCFRTARCYLFNTRIENNYLKSLLCTIVSPALLLDDRLRVNDWLAAVEYAK